MTPEPAAPGLWFERAWLPSGVAHRVRVTTDGQHISTVETDAPVRHGDVEHAGLAIPGAANVHSHAFHRVLRGAGAAGSDFWRWRTTMYRAAEKLAPAGYERLATAVFREMLLAGYTSVAEFHYLHHAPRGGRYAEPNAMGFALKSAASAAGIRLTLLDTCYLGAGFGRGPDGTQHRFSDGSAAGWAARVSELEPDPMFRVGAAIHSVRAVPETAMAQVAAWADRRRAVLHVHFSEQPEENAQALAATGLTPTGLLDRAGAWGRRTVGVHGVHVTEDDIAIIAERGAGVCVCPSTEADLADGIAPVRRMAEAGIRIGVGSDQNVQIDPFLETRSLELNERLASGRRDGLAPELLFRSLTEHGQQLAGWPEAGRIEPGALADLVVIDTASDNTTGVVPDRIPLHARPADVRAVYVGGAPVARTAPDPGLQTLIDSLREA